MNRLPMKLSAPASPHPAAEQHEGDEAVVPHVDADAHRGKIIVAARSSARARSSKSSSCTATRW